MTAKGLVVQCGSDCNDALGYAPGVQSLAGDPLRLLPEQLTCAGRFQQVDVLVVLPVDPRSDPKLFRFACNS